jgi:hypothetical protein
VFCNGADTCSGGSCSVHAGDPCAGGIECNATCNEAADNCFAPAGTACADDGNVCTNDQCTGAGTCAHPGNTAPCDDGLFCNGADTCSGGSCSVHAGDPCTGGGDCRSTCTEATDSCLAPAATACADDGNVCTNDQCDASGTCTHPNNTAPCNDGVFCNGADTCSGGSCSVHAGDPCAAGGECAGTCNEAADSCFAPSGTACRDDGNPCTIDVCGAGACTHPAGNAGAICRAATGECDLAETCDGTTPRCPADQTEPDGTACDDDNLCTDHDVCAGGVCGGAGVTCDLCEQCDPSVGCVDGPRDACRQPMRPFDSRLQIRDRPQDGGDQVTWKWFDGEATSPADLGSPVTHDDYAFCIYDGASSLISRIRAPAGGICGDALCWTPRGSQWSPTGYRYFDREGTPDGLGTLVIQSGDNGRAAAMVKGKGPNLVMPADWPLSLPLRVQLQATNGTCWEATYSDAGVIRYTGTAFDGRSD